MPVKPMKNERDNQVVAMRKQGLSYRKIGRHFGICPERARQILIRHKEEQDIAAKWPFCASLSIRTRIVLRRTFGDIAFENPEIVINYGSLNFMKMRNCGIVTVREIEAALIRLGYLKDAQEW